MKCLQEKLQSIKQVTPKLHIYEFSLELTKPPKQFQIALIYKPLIQDMGCREER